MTMQKRFPEEGIIVALAAPFDANGVLMEAELARHLAWLRETGVQGVVALGSTGEFPLLDLAQRNTVLDAVARHAGDLPVVANISDNRPSVVAELGRRARELNFAGVAIMPPSFFPTPGEDQLAHFLFAAEAAQLPVMLYNFPELTGNRIAPETVAAFAEQALMSAIKQSGGEFAYHEELVRLGKERGFVVFSGSDLRIPEARALGACGSIGGMVNYVPEIMLEQDRACRTGDTEQAQNLALRMAEVGRLVNQLSFPENVAAGLRARGFDPGTPKRCLSEPTLARIQSVAEALRTLLHGYDLSPVVPRG